MTEGVILVASTQISVALATKEAKCWSLKGINKEEMSKYCHICNVQAMISLLSGHSSHKLGFFYNSVILLLANFFVVNTVNMRGEYFYPVTVPQYYQV